MNFSYKLVFFVPTLSTRKVLNHIFATFPDTMGIVGQYEQVAFLTRGQGQFKPLASAKPVIGTVGQLEYVEEDKVEIPIHNVGSADRLKAIIDEVKKVHPYEEAVIELYRMETI